MPIETREAQILRVRSVGIHPNLSEKLSESLRLAVLSTVKTVMEGALEEELSEYLSQRLGEKPQRSGSYPRGLNIHDTNVNYGLMPRCNIATSGNKTKKVRPANMAGKSI
jgi:hypothetical protein